MTVTCHLTCGLGGRARRRRAIPEPRQHPGPLDPHNAAHPRGRMSPRLGLPPPRGSPAASPPATTSHGGVPPYQAAQGVPREACSQQDVFLFKVARSYPGGSHTGRAPRPGLSTSRAGTDDTFVPQQEPSIWVQTRFQVPPAGLSKPRSSRRTTRPGRVTPQGHQSARESSYTSPSPAKSRAAQKPPTTSDFTPL